MSSNPFIFWLGFIVSPLENHEFGDGDLWFPGNPKTRKPPWQRKKEDQPPSLRFKCSLVLPWPQAEHVGVRAQQREEEARPERGEGREVRARALRAGVRHPGEHAPVTCARRDMGLISPLLLCFYR